MIFTAFRGHTGMSTTTDTYLRELDHRQSDGIDVRLLWNSATNRVSVSVHDTKLGESFELDVDGAEALDAFHHPYAYAGRDGRPVEPLVA
jgi:hypothetical protein